MPGGQNRASRNEETGVLPRLATTTHMTCCRLLSVKTGMPEGDLIALPRQPRMVSTLRARGILRRCKLRQLYQFDCAGSAYAWGTTLRTRPFQRRFMAWGCLLHSRTPKRLTYSRKTCGLPGQRQLHVPVRHDRNGRRLLKRATCFDMPIFQKVSVVSQKKIYVCRLPVP